VRSLVVLVLFAALAASACSAGSDTAADERPTTTQETTPAAETRLFTKAELAKLALQPSDAPTGMRYTKVDSGPKTLLDVGIVLDDQVAQIRGLGIRGIYDATFDSKTTDVRLASRIWLFAEADGAERWFEKSRSESELYGFEQITAPPLGEDSWAARGNVGAAVISYAFRTGNAVVVTSYSTQSQELSESAALAAAQRAEARLRAA
jgi:hypothetical protein